MQLTDVQAAYLAGIVDGEGTIGMVKNACKGGDRKIRFRVRLSITSTSLELVSLLVGTLDGNPQWTRKNHPKHAPSCRVCWPEIPSENFIKQMLPYLVIKRPQAELFLRYRRLQAFCWANRRASRKAIKSVRFLRDWYFQEFRRLNARGPKSVEANTPDFTAYDHAVGKIESELHGNMQRVIGDNAPPTIQ